MKCLHGVLLVLLVAVQAGCVSTTTGSKIPDADQGDAATALFQLGVGYFQNGNYELARDRLEQSLEKDPKRPMVWSTLGATYEMLDNPRLAEEAYNKAIKLAPKNFDVQNAYAVFLCRQRRFDDAEHQFDRSIKAATNDNPEVMMTNAGVCMMQKPDYVKAEEYFRQALERRPNHAEALLQMAVLKHATGDDFGARAFLERYRVSNADNPGVLYLCALVEGELGDEKARSECEDRLFKSFPRSAEAKKLRSKS